MDGRLVCVMDWVTFATFCSFLGRAGVIPSCNTTRKTAFYGASVKVGESRSGHAKFPSSSEKVEALVGFLNYSVGMGGDQNRLLVIWTPKNLKLSTLSTSSPLM